MEARLIRAAILTALIVVSFGNVSSAARHRSANFIVDTSSPALAAEIAQAAEKYRHDLAIEWLGKAMPDWSQPCMMTVQVGPRLGAGGATTFVFDRGEVFGWRMTIQGSRQRVLDSVLPHEITHMIFASHFRQPLPRWADEGGATSVEHASERMKHRKMLLRFLRTGRGIAFSRMFAMQEYPRDIMPLYAQGYSLTDYLIQLGGKRKYVEFLGDGLKTQQWSAAIRRHYDVSSTGSASGLGTLQNAWLAWVRQGSPRLERPQETAPQQPRAEMVAVAQRRKRPEPNLIYRIPEQESYAPGSVIPAQHLARTDSPSQPKQLPAAGWRPVGVTPPEANVATSGPTAGAQPSSTGPVHNQVTHPQGFERSRQIILEWDGEWKRR